MNIVMMNGTVPRINEIKCIHQNRLQCNTSLLSVDGGR